MEPIRTDEPRAAGDIQRAPDMDTAMLGGCSVFLVTAVLSFALAVWPHLVYPDAHRIANLRMCLLIGLVPSTAIGLVAALRGGLAGACGFVGGALITSVFFFLRLQQVFITAGSRTGPTPDYSPTAVYLLPLAWFCVATLVALVAAPKSGHRGLGAENSE